MYTLQYWIYLVLLTDILCVTQSGNGKPKTTVIKKDLLKTFQNKSELFTKRSNKKNSTLTHNNVYQDIKRYFAQLVANGKVAISKTGKCLEKQFKNTKKVVKTIRNAAKEFVSNLKNYLGKLLEEEKPIYDVDKKFIILDLVETAHDVLYNLSSKILHNSIHFLNISIPNENKTVAKIRFLEHDINELVNEAKKEELVYLCTDLKICRPVKGYSKYLSDLCHEILKLSDSRLNYFIMNLVVIFKGQNGIFKTVLGEKLAESLGNKLNVLSSHDTSQIRRIMIAFKDLFGRKYRLHESKKDGRIKAFKILLDIVDKSFNDEELLRIFFCLTLRSLNNWSMMKTYDVTLVIQHFLRHTLNTLKYNWKSETREEVKTLIEVILRKEVINKEVYDHLFTRGSKFVNLPPELDIDLI